MPERLRLNGVKFAAPCKGLLLLLGALRLSRTGCRHPLSAGPACTKLGDIAKFIARDGIVLVQAYRLIECGFCFVEAIQIDQADAKQTKEPRAVERKLKVRIIE